MSEEFQANDTAQLTIPTEQAGMRLDAALAALLPDLSRTRIRQLMEEGQVFLNGTPCADASRRVKGGEGVALTLPEPVEAVPQPQDIKLDIVYEDADLLVVNKPAGLVVHPGAGHHDGTLVNALLYHCGDTLSGIGGVKRPGIVHRLDGDTSGLMIVAKHDTAHRHLSAQLSDRSLTRVYHAFVWGEPFPARGVVETMIGRHPSSRQKMAVVTRNGKEAVTHYAMVARYPGLFSKIECRLKTGRTHQIRVHMQHIRLPLIGDPLYGLGRTDAQARLRKAGLSGAEAAPLLGLGRQALHASAISFIHPATGMLQSFNCALPDDLKEIDKLLN